MSFTKFPKIVGILNITPDSFSDGGKYFTVSTAVNHALQLLDEGADIIDIGGESTRPGAESVSASAEFARVIPVIEGILKIRPDTQISIDTTKYEVAKAALDLGVSYINDISGLTYEPKFAELAANYNAGLVIMHMQGQPRTMQTNPIYTDVVDEVFLYLKEKIEFAKACGVNNVIADVGIGFGKNLEHNLTLIKNIAEFHKLEVPLYLGISRKSFMKMQLGIENAEERDLPTLIYHSILLKDNIDFIRVHNVKQISLLKQIALQVYKQ